MDCKQAQRWYDELADGRLAEAQAVELRRHLAGCTDCRVAQQRAQRLQLLLRLKRHEQPPPGYFNNFLADFHRRLAAEEEARASRWQWIRDLWRPLPSVRYALVTTASLLLAVGLFWQLNAAPRTIAQDHPTNPAPTVTHHDITLAVAVPVAATPRYVLDHIAVTPASYEAGSIRF
jgi:predicted anti-sigma-YlaC factor YlaD